MDIPRRNNLKNNNLKNRISRDKCPGRPCSALRHLDRILLFPINVWVTENGGNTEIQPGFVADVLQTLSLSQRLPSLRPVFDGMYALPAALALVC